MFEAFEILMGWSIRPFSFFQNSPR